MLTFKDSLAFPPDVVTHPYPRNEPDSLVAWYCLRVRTSRPRRLVRLVTHDAEPLLGLLQSFYSSLYRHRNDVQQRQVRAQVLFPSNTTYTEGVSFVMQQYRSPVVRATVVCVGIRGTCSLLTPPAVPFFAFRPLFFSGLWFPCSRLSCVCRRLLVCVRMLLWDSWFFAAAAFGRADHQGQAQPPPRPGGVRVHHEVLRLRGRRPARPRPREDRRRRRLWCGRASYPRGEGGAPPSDVFFFFLLCPCFSVLASCLPSCLPACLPQACLFACFSRVQEASPWPAPRSRSD